MNPASDITSAVTETTGAGATVTVAVCVITYRRPQGLEALLRSIARLRLAGPMPAVSVVVVENEAGGPAAGVCRRMESTLPFPLRFAVESQRGIPYARNTAIRTAGEVDFVAFVDDDEVVDPDWLEHLLSAAQKYEADVVAAPAVSVYASGVADWVKRGRFHVRRRHRTGTRVLPMSTCNCLLRRSMLEKIEPWFDTRFALTGGSDSQLFQRVARAGFVCVWSDEAVVRETVPLSRATPIWIWKRAFRAGANYGFMLWGLEPAWRVVWLVTREAGKHLGWGAAGMLLAPFRGRHALVKQVEHLCRGLGILSGCLGRQHEEYRTVHGQ